MKSTLPVLEAETQPDGSVELSKAGVPFHRYEPWLSISAATKLVYINKQYYQLRWAVAKK